MFVNGQPGATLQAELGAMQQIAFILGSLDSAARARVIQWAVQRLQDDVPVTQPAAPRPLAVVPVRVPVELAEPVLADETLSVNTLDELFEPVAAAPDPAAQPVIGLLHEFVVEFQNIARDWNVACDEQADRAADQRASSAA